MTLIAHHSANLRIYALHRAADILDLIAVTLYAISAMIVAASVPFYWLSGFVDMLSAALRPNSRG